MSIDLDDDNICSVCKLGTEKETLSFCHICFELNIEGKVGAGAILGRPAGRGLNAEPAPLKASIESQVWKRVSVESFKPVCFLSRFR